MQTNESPNGENRFDNVGSLSRLWLGRYHSSYPRYKGNTLIYLSAMSDRGKNSFETITTKSDIVNASSGNNLNYNRALTAAFQLNVPVDPSSISSVVCTALSKFGFNRLKGNITKQCIDELNKLFIVHERMVDGKNVKKERVYIPVFALLAE